MEFLTSDQRRVLKTFRKLIADAREPEASAQLLAMCDGNMEQALLLHWTTVGDDAENTLTPATSRSNDGTLNQKMQDGVASSTTLQHMVFARSGAAQAQILLFCPPFCGHRSGLQPPPLHGSVARAVPVKAQCLY